MWEKVSNRSHKPIQIHAFGGLSSDVMLHGTVDYVLKDGRKSTVEWAARGHLVYEKDVQQMDFYQVYLVSIFT